MEHRVYNRRAWRELPRDECVVAFLFGEAVGPCSHPIDRHHVDPDDPDSRSVQVCHRHHPSLQAALRVLTRPVRRRRCPHVHRYDHARRECEARLNAAA